MLRRYLAKQVHTNENLLIKRLNAKIRHNFDDDDREHRVTNRETIKMKLIIGIELKMM